jgi:single-strand DNA-binding protein
VANVNKVILIGNLTRDIEVRYTPKGTAVTDLGMAVNRIWNDEQGQRREDATFIDVTLWGRLAELAGQYLQKGRQVYIEGRLQMDSWDDRETGQKRTKLKVVGEVMQFLDSRGGGEGGGGGGSGYAPQGRGQQDYGYGEGGNSGYQQGGGGGGGYNQGGGGGGPQRGGPRQGPPQGQGGGGGGYNQEPPPQQPDFDDEEDDDIPF